MNEKSACAATASTRQSAGARRRCRPAIRRAVDGSFPSSDLFIAALGNRANVVRKAASAHGETLVATAAVRRWLREDMDDRSDEWAAAAPKAERWLAQ
jgi:hypothetical protein